MRGVDVTTVDGVLQALDRRDLVGAKLAGDPDGRVNEAAAKLELFTR